MEELQLAEKSIDQITGYHAHIYYDPNKRQNVEEIREQLGANFDVVLGRWHDVPVGPHTAAMYQVAFTPQEFIKIAPWLMLNRQGASILLHPETGNDLADHTDYAIWYGTRLDLFLDVLK